MPAADDDLSGLAHRCTRFLHGHGPVRAADLLATIPADTAVDRYGDGGVVDKLETEIASLLGKPAALFLPSGTMAQQAVLRVHAERRQRHTIVFHPMCHLDQHEGHAYQRLHRLTGRPAGDPSRLVTLADLEAISEPVAALLLELPQRDIGGQQPSLEDLADQAGWAAAAVPRFIWTAPGSGSRRPGTGVSPPRSPRCSTRRTSRSTRESARCPAAAWPGRRRSSPRSATGGTGWAAPCSACGRTPHPP